jgi:hypothetical protein
MCAALALGLAAPMASAQSSQTEIVSGLWEGARPALAHAAPHDDQEFYQVPASFDLNAAAPGTVLREREIDYHVATLPTPVRVTQILYATTNVRGEIEENVTSVLHPPGAASGNVVSYQSFYDSLNPLDNPSRIIAGNQSLGGLITTGETALIAPALLAGHAVVIADIQGKDANFASGPGYGTATLDSLRAAIASASAPVRQDSRIGLLGYSGGAIGTNWAAILVSEYAPELQSQIVGAAQGGLLVNPVNNLGYAGDGPLWSGVVGMALAGLTRAYDVDTSQYLNEHGQRVVEDVRNLSIVEALGRYPNLRWADIARPEFPTPQDAPELMNVIRQINMGTRSQSTIPMFVFEGAGGFLEGTPPGGAGVGPGDGVMVAGDVRTLMRDYCAVGAQIEYREYPWLSHGMTAVPWLIEGYHWLEGRLRGVPATNNCHTIPPGNDLTEG